jgi:hypothetical protein
MRTDPGVVATTFVLICRAAPCRRALSCPIVAGALRSGTCKGCCWYSAACFAVDVMEAEGTRLSLTALRVVVTVFTRGLTFEVTRPCQQEAWGARPMIGCTASRPKTPAGAGRVDRRVRRHCERQVCETAEPKAECPLWLARRYG